MKRETVFRKRVLKFLHTLKNTAYFPIQQRAIVGDPDYMLCSNGLFIALELKGGEEDEPRPKQLEKLEWIRKNGGVTLVCCPENFDSVKGILLEFDRRKHVVPSNKKKIN